MRMMMMMMMMSPMKFNPITPEIQPHYPWQLGLDLVDGGRSLLNLRFANDITY